MLPTSLEEQQLPQTEEDPWQQAAEADAGKPRQEIVLRLCFKLAHPSNMGSIHPHCCSIPGLKKTENESCSSMTYF